MLSNKIINKNKLSKRHIEEFLKVHNLIKENYFLALKAYYENNNEISYEKINTHINVLVKHFWDKFYENNQIYQRDWWRWRELNPQQKINN